MNKLNVVKTVVNFFVGAGTAKITHAVISNNVEPETTTDKVAVFAGSAALSGIAMDASKSYTSAKIDEIAAIWTDKKESKKVPNITEV